MYTQIFNIYLAVFDYCRQFLDVIYIDLQRLSAIKRLNVYVVMNEFWKRRACVILTGASKGIGQRMAVEIGKSLMLESTVVLIARDAGGLEKTKESLLKENREISVKVKKQSMEKRIIL